MVSEIDELDEIDNDPRANEPWRRFVRGFKNDEAFMAALQEFWPDQPFICKQTEVPQLREQYPDIQFVEYDEAAKFRLPIGTLNGIHLYTRDVEAVDHPSVTSVIRSAALIVNEVPTAAVVLMSGENQRVHHVGINGEIGAYTDLGIFPHCRCEVSPLSESVIGIGVNRNTHQYTYENFVKYAINPVLELPCGKVQQEVPIVDGVMGVVRGELAAFLVYSARPEEVAASLALCKANAMWTNELNGWGVHWTCSRLEDLLFARDREAAKFVVDAVDGYIGRHKVDTR